MVSCPSESVRKRVEAVLDMAITTVSSLTESFITGASMTPEDADPKQEKSSSPGRADADPVEDKISVAEADIAS